MKLIRMIVIGVFKHPNERLTFEEDIIHSRLVGDVSGF